MASIEFSFAPGVVLPEADARWLARRLIHRGQTFEPALLVGLEIEQLASQAFDALRQVELTGEERHELSRVLAAVDEVGAGGRCLLNALQNRLTASLSRHD